MDIVEGHLKKEVMIDRDYYNARTNLAVVYSRQGKNDLAEEELRKALDVNPDIPEVHYSLGLLLSEQKKYEEAVRHLQKAADGMVHNSRAYFNLGQLYDFLHHKKKAETALRKSIAIDPGNMQYLQTMARFYMARRKYAEAKIIAEQMAVVDPANPFSQQLLDFIRGKARE
jgi:Tfp pilus assembly protein PilF